MRKATPKEETYNYYGDDARKIEIKALGDHGAFIMFLRKDVHKDEVCVNDRFDYTVKQSAESWPCKNGLIYRWAAKVRCAFCAKGDREDVGEMRQRQQRNYAV